MPNTFPFYDAQPYWPKNNYGNQGGSGDGSGDQGGSGSAATTDFYIFVNSFDKTAAPELAIGDPYADPTPLEYEQMTVEFRPPIEGAESQTQYCYRYKDCPVGARISNRNALSGTVPILSYSDVLGLPNSPTTSKVMARTDPLYCPRPEDGAYIIGQLAD